jgi:uncharacterized protein YcbK (DUF882 family)
LGAASSLGFSLISKPLYASHPSQIPEKTVKLYNQHTGEMLKSTYWVNGEVVDDSLEEISYLLRDHRTGEMIDIDVQLLDQVVQLQRLLESESEFNVISGYRSPKTNEMLRSHTDGVARNSFHTRGRAIDLRMPGKNIRNVYAAALKMRAGGAGFYRSGFIHLDTGVVRNWRG